MVDDKKHNDDPIENIVDLESLYCDNGHQVDYCENSPYDDVGIQCDVCA